MRLEETRQALEPLMDAITALGRLPDPTEFRGAATVCERFGSLKRAFAVVRRLTGPAAWDALAERRREDLLVYLALARFGKRPARSQLPVGLQRDMTAFFGGYAKACALADDLLFRAGDPPAIDAACAHSAVGKLLPDDLYVHRSALDALEPVLRVYKEVFWAADHPLHGKFARLTRQEEAHGLLDEPAAIGTRAGWERRLHDTGYALRAHRLVRRQRGHSET